MADCGLDLLCSSAKLDRDRGVVELQKHLNETNEDGVRRIEQAVQQLLDNKDASWETKHGALMGVQELLTLGLSTSQRTATGVTVVRQDGSNVKCSDQFANVAKEYALKLLEDNESRVRLSAGEVVGALCRRLGAGVYEEVREDILAGVRLNLERHELMEASEQEVTNQLQQKLSSSPTRERRSSISAEEIFHDTAGWKALETWMKCLQAVIGGCGTAFNEYIDRDLLDLIFEALGHTNRFVRETGYYVCGSLVSCNYSTDGSMMVPVAENAIYRHGDEFTEQLARGLADNWSQVRLASSVATRQFLLGLSEESRQKFYPALLPRLCLNRYYVAEGVRIYNQETWKLVTCGRGQTMVETYIKEVVAFYVLQTEADNHAVREAACACIAELGSKVSQDVARPHVPALLDALLVCFRDESWPVRDASCVACGNFILCFPAEARSAMTELYPLFFDNLHDNIPSVRQGAALALSNVVRAYSQDALPIIMKKMKEGLEGVEKQAVTAEMYSDLDLGPATYGVVKRARDNDPALHTDRQMYSCGSLAPKMHRGKRTGGCMDHQFQRPSEPWELTDGCVHLFAELCQVSDSSAQVAQLVPLLIKAVSYHHYTQHLHLLETLCKRLPNIATGLGKRPFKSHVESFFDTIFYSFTSDNALTSAAASHCLSQLSAFLGPSILRGRVEQYNPNYLQTLEMCLAARPAGL